MSEWVYLNGEFLRLEDARVPVEDRGYNFGDGIYEVVKFFSGQPFLLDRHMARLVRSAAEMEIPLPDLDGLVAAMQELVRRNDVPEGGVYIQITRGVARRSHAYPGPMVPTVLILARNLGFIGDEIRYGGVGVITRPDERWGRCDIKSLNLLANVMAREQARRAGAFEAILVRDGLVTEASSHSFFAVRDGSLWTHPAGPRILPSITRGRTLELARELGLTVREEAVPADQLGRVDEAFLTGTGNLVVPVVMIDGLPVGSATPGPLTARLRDAFLAEVAAAIK